MIKQIKYIKSRQHNPYLNLALEEYLLQNVKKDECILYLWQNERTVVIGRNQNPWKECKIRELNDDGGHLVRRLSGGGAVFHDLGNLNFTFLVQKENYNVDKQLEVIIKALDNLGITAEKSGRNDIILDGKKFSGNAFYSDASHCYHHGTILVNVNMDYLSKYLNVSRDKLKSKGVNSVKSRVTNLIEHRPDLTIDMMNRELVNAFSEVYDLIPQKIKIEEINQVDIHKKRDRFASWDWLYGTKIPFVYNIDKRFPWGNFEIQINADKGKITHCRVFSDAMDIDIIDKIPQALIGVVFSSKEIVKALQDYMNDMVLNDVTSRAFQRDISQQEHTKHREIGQENIKAIMLNDICELIINENL